ncbi:MAG: ABC transporter substrate-binding protein [Oscillospiraceae bacterium]|nr:ABC transporter substrate-binding protein [Oscillospiraceae bacterium]
MLKKTVALLLCLAMVFTLCLAGCGQADSSAPADSSADTDAASTDTASTEAEAAEGDATEAEATDASATADEPEGTYKAVIAATPFSGMVLHYIADYCGFYEDEGVEVTMEYVNDFNSLLESVNKGAINIGTTYGTAGPLIDMANGHDTTIFAGYMLQGCMPILAKEGTVWNGVEDLLGKTVTSRGGGGSGNAPIYRALLDLGHDPMTEVNWMHGVDQTVALEMGAKGEADYVVGTTGIQTTAKDFGLVPVAFLSDLQPEYSCCRIWALTDWLNENQETVDRLLRAWIRAEEVLETDRDLAVQLTVENTDLNQEYVEGFEKDPHWMVNLDPHWKGVSTYAATLMEVGILPEWSNDELAKHFNCEMYKQALDECAEKYGSENPDFYAKYQASYEEANADYLANYANQ